MARAALCGTLSAALLGLPLVFCGAATPARAWYHRCWECDLPEDDIPFQWDDGASGAPEVGPFPQGFALTAAVKPGGLPGAGPSSLNRYIEVADALGRCWSSHLSADDAHWQDMTLRISFKRDGSINGLPRIAHVTSSADPAADAAGRRSLLAALGHCTPLAFSPSLGQAIAGQIFAIRFVQQRTS